MVGTVTAFDGKYVTIKLKKDGVTLRIALPQLAPATQYELTVAHDPPVDAADHLRLGQFCLKHRLLAPARKHLLRAGKLDPKLSDRLALRFEELNELAAEVRYRAVLKLGKARRYAEALKQIQALKKQYPDSMPTRWAQELAAGYQQAILARKLARQNQRSGRANQRALAKELAKENVRQHLRNLTQGHQREAQTNRAAALRAEGEGQESRSMMRFREASSGYESALSAAQKLRKKVDDRRHLQQALDWQQQIIHAWTLLAISAAHLRARQGNWKDAHRWLDLAIRLEPLNADARRLHKKVSERRIVKSLQKLTNAKPIIKNR